MSEEFHYPPRKFEQLKRQLPVHPYPREKFLSEYRPPGASEDEWNAIDYDEEDSPKKIMVCVDADTRREITSVSSRIGPFISACELFLEAMRQHIQQAITNEEEWVYATDIQIANKIKNCDDRFSELLDYVRELPYYVQCELDTRLVDSLKKSLKKLIKSTRTHFEGLPENSFNKSPPNIFREPFLDLMLREYHNFFGNLPGHTGEHPFKKVAGKLCGIAHFSPKGMQDALAKAKARFSS
jgi:hypothetical protein